MDFPSDFAGFLARQWSENPDPLHPIEPKVGPSGRGQRPWHGYEITQHPCWNEWKVGGTGTCSLALAESARRSAWWCASLGEAARHYSWTPSPHGSFASLAAELRAEMKASRVANAASVCHRVLDWGGVARKAQSASRRWIRDQESAGTLIDALASAVWQLRPDTDALSRFEFNGIDLPMNSATTKLFAAADPTDATLIFDGRVGAALCLLVRRFLELRKAAMPVQLELLFYWGPQPGRRRGLRDPSTPRFVFRDINRVTSLARAQASKRANVVARRLHEQAGVAPDQLERALFMVGYCVNP